MCEYCRNKSRMEDKRGNCISCGAPLSLSEQEKQPYYPPDSGGLAPEFLDVPDPNNYARMIRLGLKGKNS